MLGTASIARPSTITMEQSAGRQVIPGINTDIRESALQHKVADHRIPTKGNAADPIQAFSLQVRVYFPHHLRWLLVFAVSVTACC